MQDKSLQLSDAANHRAGLHDSLLRDLAPEGLALTKRARYLLDKWLGGAWPPTFSADAACSIRAHGSLNPDVRRRNPDYLARQLMSSRLSIGMLPLAQRIFFRRCQDIAPGIYFLHQTRTRHFDAVLRDELGKGARQVVIFGAGFDSRAYRFAAQLREVRVFEVDHPDSSAEKRRRLKRVLGALPLHVTYVPVDFMHSTAEAELVRAGFDASLRTFFLAEGLSYYLSDAAIESLFKVVAESAAGSSIALDYMTREAIERPDAIALQHHRSVLRYHQRYSFGVDHDDVRALFLRYGLEPMEVLPAAELNRRYLVGRDDFAPGEVPSLFGVAQGMV